MEEDYLNKQKIKMHSTIIIMVNTILLVYVKRLLVCCIINHDFDKKLNIEDMKVFHKSDVQLYLMFMQNIIFFHTKNQYNEILYVISYKILVLMTKDWFKNIYIFDIFKIKKLM